MKVLELAQRAMKVFENAKEEKPNPEFVMCLHVVAALYCSLCQYSEAIPLLERSIEIPFKGGFMVDYGIGLGGVGLVLVQGGAKVDWFDPRPAGSAGAPSLTRVPAGTTMPGPTRVLTDTIIGIRAMVDPRTCEVVPVARLSGVERTRLSLSLHNTRGAAIKVVVQVLRFKGRFMVDYGIGLGGARPVLVQCGAEVDWFDPRWRLLRMVGSNH
ncbi:hypothetical protein LguiA_014214 [Lonicera macranthoides]